MKLVKQASGKTTIKMSKSEWTDLGKKAGWMKEAHSERLLGVINNRDRFRKSQKTEGYWDELIDKYFKVLAKELQDPLTNYNSFRNTGMDKTQWERLVYNRLLSDFDERPDYKEQVWRIIQEQTKESMAKVFPLIKDDFINEVARGERFNLNVFLSFFGNEMKDEERDIYEKAGKRRKEIDSARKKWESMQKKWEMENRDKVVENYIRDHIQIYGGDYNIESESELLSVIDTINELSKTSENHEVWNDLYEAITSVKSFRENAFSQEGSYVDEDGFTDYDDFWDDSDKLGERESEKLLAKYPDLMPWGNLLYYVIIRADVSNQ